MDANVSNLIGLIVVALVVGLSLTWVNIKAGTGWLKALTLAGCLAGFAVALVGLYQLTIAVL